MNDEVDFRQLAAMRDALKEHFAQIAESWTPDQWEIHPREDFARKEIAAAIRRA